MPCNQDLDVVTNCKYSILTIQYINCLYLTNSTDLNLTSPDEGDVITPGKSPLPFLLVYTVGYNCGVVITQSCRVGVRNMLALKGVLKINGNFNHFFLVLKCSRNILMGRFLSQVCKLLFCSKAYEIFAIFVCLYTVFGLEFYIFFRL